MPGEYSKTFAVIGIDPGLTGAFAMVQIHEGGERQFMGGARMCVESQDKAGPLGAKSRVISHYGVAATLDGMQKDARGDIWCCIEGQSYRKRQAVRSTFVTAFNYGILWTAAAAVFPYTTSIVLPEIWKRDLGLSPSKALSKRIAAELFEQDFQTEGIAEAALIAWWRARRLTAMLAQ